MVKDVRPLVQNFSNADWLNAVRNISGSDYVNRVPEATQANITEVIENLWNVPALRNQFIDALVNRIGLVIFKNLTWTNPLAKFKRGMLNYGETIEEIMAGLLTAATYDPKRDELEQEIFGAMTPEVQVSYHHVDRRDKYKLTVREAELRKAFLNGGGVSEFMTNLMGMLQNSDQWDEFNIMANLFNEMDKADGFFNVNVADVGDPASTADESKGMLRALRSMGNRLPFISRMYNPAGLPVAAQPSELELFITSDADAALDVEALAGAFNISKAEFASRKTVLPKEHFGITDVQAILTTRDFFVCADQRIEVASIYNPSSLLNNYWLHHWGVYSVSRFAPAILFSTRPSTVITINDTPVTGIEAIVLKDRTGTVVTAVKRGNTYSVENNAITTPTGGSNDAVVYAVVPGTGAANGPFTLSQFTYITNDGVLVVGPDEQNEKLTINTVSLDNEAYTATSTVNVTGDLIIPWPNPTVIPDSDLDSLPEVTPEKPGWDGAHTITIPNVTGVQYKNGATNVNNGTTITVASGTPVTINAVARAGYELAAGAVATWTFTYNTP